MSFYGSVYYQLIDTFHKITGRNSGKNTVTLPSSTADSDLEATGRKSVINLDTGNRWINISKSGEAFLLSHRGTDNNNIKSPVKAVEVIDGTGEGSGENKNSAKQLNYEDVLKVNTIHRDEAGHITTKTEPFYIKLPAEPPITDDIKSLQYYSGIRNEPKDPENPTDAELTNKTIATNTKLYEKTVSNSAMTDPKTNLYNYVIHNYEVAKIHKGPLHDWSGICNSYNNNANNQNNITIKKAIGDLDNLFQGGTYKNYLGSNGGSKVYVGGIVSCIGNMYALHEPFKKQESVAFSLVDALLDLNNRLAESNKNISQNAEANETTSNLINEHIDASKTRFSSIDTSLTTINTTIGTSSGIPIYQEIAGLHSKDEEILGILGTRLNQNLTAFGEIAALQTKTDNTNKVVNDNKSALDAKDAELKDLIDETNELIGTRLNTNKTVFNEITDTNTLINNYKIALDGEDDRLEGLIGDINNLIGARLNDNKTVFNEITDINNLIGTRLNNDNTVFDEITTVNNSIIEKNNALNGRIDGINNLIGTRLDDNKTVFDEITSINNLIGTKLNDNKTVFNEITDINNLIGTRLNSDKTVFDEITSVNNYFTNMTKTTVKEEIDSSISAFNTNSLSKTLENYVTYAYLSQEYKNLTDSYYISKNELSSLATKDELSSLATKDELSSLATKDELSSYLLSDNLASSIDATIANNFASVEEGQSTLNTLSELLNKVIELEGKIKELTNPEE